ncbi:MAG: HD domain-containing protein [Dehalococcoidia bacterium]|nr:HD domain-containing protein [Dehalococcoidia bacterium]
MKTEWRFKTKKEIMKLLSTLRELLAQRSTQCYLTGGFVRDALMGRATSDIDLVIGGKAMELAREIADILGGRYVPLDQANEIARVVLPGEKPLHLDFATMRGSIEEDLALRDFTIDAIALNLREMDEPVFIDPFGGLRDLEEGVVRAISEEAFLRDPARLLRTLRLGAELGFSIDGETKTQIERHHQLITHVASERVRDELCRLLAAPKAAKWLRLLDELGLLLEILPELSPIKGAEQPKEHFWDVFEHSIETVAAVEFLLRIEGLTYDDEILALVPWSPALEEHFEEVASGHSRKTLLKLAGLLHDIAKPQTRSIDEMGRMRFFGHAKEGASIAEGILARLRFSAREKDMVQKMIEHHLRPGQMGEEMPSHRAVYRYFRDTGGVGIDTLFLNLADHLATRGPNLELEEWQRHARSIAYVLEERFREESIVAPPKLIDGHDLIDIFGMMPGPKIGELLEAVREAQAAGEVATREEAFSFIERLLPVNP